MGIVDVVEEEEGVSVGRSLLDEVAAGGEKSW